MLHDGLAQRLLELDWRRILVLRGPQDEDKAWPRRFWPRPGNLALRIVELRDFVAGNDPRKRDQINIKLLTGGIDYDALFVADALGILRARCPSTPPSRARWSAAPASKPRRGIPIGSGMGRRSSTAGSSAWSGDV